MYLSLLSRQNSTCLAKVSFPKDPSYAAIAQYRRQGDTSLNEQESSMEKEERELQRQKETLTRQNIKDIELQLQGILCLLKLIFFS